MHETWLPIIDARLCTGCGDCIAACPEQVLQLQHEKAVLAAPAQCTFCRDCEEICPTQAIELPFMVIFSPPPTPDITETVANKTHESGNEL